MKGREKRHELKNRSVKLHDGWDVIVAGGGPAGCAAAIAAAREGAKTLLLEASGCLGGMGTSGLVHGWCPHTDKSREIYRGVAGKIFDEMKKQTPHGEGIIHAEELKRTCDELLEEAGAEVLFNTFTAGVEKNGADSIDCLLAANKEGLAAYKADVYVDCTGDGDVAAWAGAEFAKGDEDGETQPVSHCFLLSNVDAYAYFHKRGGWCTSQIINSGKYPDVEDRFLGHVMTGPSTVGFNPSHVYGVDGTDPFSVSKALAKGRRIARQLRDALAEFWPQAFADSFLATTASALGVRETRRVVGDYVLNVEDYLARRHFPDEIALCNFFVDIHPSKKELGAPGAEWGKVNNGRCEIYKEDESYGIPYRCLTPKGLKNVLVAGRCISTDRYLQGSSRVMPACLCMGEAAGIAAAMTARSDEKDAHKTDAAIVRQKLRGHGAFLP